MKNIILTGVSRGLGKCLFDALVGSADTRVIAVGRRFPEDMWERLLGEAFRGEWHGTKTL